MDFSRNAHAACLFKSKLLPPILERMSLKSAVSAFCQKQVADSHDRIGKSDGITRDSSS